MKQEREQPTTWNLPTRVAFRFAFVCFLLPSLRESAELIMREAMLAGRVPDVADRRAS
jgi:hypothetical protein